MIIDTSLSYVPFCNSAAWRQILWSRPTILDDLCGAVAGVWMRTTTSMLDWPTGRFWSMTFETQAVTCKTSPLKKPGRQLLTSLLEVVAFSQIVLVGFQLASSPHRGLFTKLNRIRKIFRNYVHDSSHGRKLLYQGIPVFAYFGGTRQ